MNNETYEKNGIVYSQKSFLKPQQIWFVKFNGAIALSEHRIVQITEQTVLLCALESPLKTNYRYKISDVEFVEMSKAK